MLTTNPDFEPDDEGLAFAGDATMQALFRHAPQTTGFNKLRKKLIRQVRQAFDTFGMLNGQKRWLVCLSGGKDSYGLLAVLLELRWRGLLPVDLVACNLDQGQPNFPKHVLPDYLAALGVKHRIEYRDTYSIVTEKVPEGATYCSLCSRLRRGNLYRIAREEGCDAVVLGHHREDIIETFFMNFFHGGRLAAMPPKLLNDDGDLMLLRPLSYCAEDDLARFAAAMQFPLAHPAVGTVLVGVRSVAELEENVHNFTRPIPGDLWRELRAEGLVPADVPLPGASEG